MTSSQADLGTFLRILYDPLFLNQSIVAGKISTKNLVLAKPGTITSSLVSHKMNQGEEKGALFTEAIENMLKTVFDLTCSYQCLDSQPPRTADKYAC